MADIRQVRKLLAFRLDGDAHAELEDRGSAPRILAVECLQRTEIGCRNSATRPKESDNVRIRFEIAAPEACLEDIKEIAQRIHPATLNLWRQAGRIGIELVERAFELLEAVRDPILEIKQGLCRLRR